MKIKAFPEQREETRFEDIYLSYFSKMKYFAKEYVISEEDAENIVQDVFVELWENKEMLNMHMNLIAYLFTTIKNKCLNHLRHKLVVQETASKLQEEYTISLHCRRAVRLSGADAAGVFSVQTSLKTLAIRQDCGGFLPCWTKNPLANPRTLRS